MSLTQLGETPKTIWLKGPEMHKLHHEFEVAAGQAIAVGQPVILNADGTIQVAGVAAKTNTVIGYSVHQADAGEMATVALKAYAVVWASPKAALDAGPVKTDGLNVTDPLYNSFTVATVDGTDTVGWALDQSTGADEIIRVALT